jgi:hypothetical protein
VLVVEDAYTTIPSLDAYLDLVLQGRKQTIPSMVETNRESATLAGLTARRMYSHWETGGLTLRGFSSVCTDRFYFYLLTGWCLNSGFTRAFSAFKDLEKGFRITRSYDERLEDMMGPVVEQYPFISMTGAKVLGEAIMAEHLTVVQAQRFGMDTMNRGRQLLPRPDLEEMEHFMEDAFSSLPTADVDRFYSYRERAINGETLTAAERAEAAALMKAALFNLSAATRARLQALGDKAVCLALGAPIEAEGDARPIKLTGLIAALRLGGLTQAEIIQRVRHRGVAFLVTPEVEIDLSRSGASPALIECVKVNYKSGGA